ncbi:hypothetical protein L6164_012124 [Bauhinia variegata]|uniref:Uncharacterized protein n=1 Tax=Bauhinia variegata TaxID=167791 RepID=A0ACB9PAL7_BAUVA|nr:hypothetical protein L6164_012124 [Bauhinia variegata]
MKCLQSQSHSPDSFTRLASFICDSDEDEPFSEQDLQLIEAIETQFQSSASASGSASSLPKKRPFDPTHDHDHSAATLDESTPQSKRRLPESLIALQHPNAFSLSPCQGRMRLPIFKFSGRIMYSRTANEVEKAVMDLLKTLEEKKRDMAQIVLGFDIEWKPTFLKGVPPRKAAVMQICSDTSRCHVLHIFHSGIPQCLQLLLEDPTVSKVGVGITGDARKVFKDYNVSVKGVEDLSFHANRKLGREPRSWSLVSLTELLVSKQLQKSQKIRMGNWETRFLSQKQLDYAATDAFASWYLYQVIRNLPDTQEVAADEGSQGEIVPQK